MIENILPSQIVLFDAGAKGGTLELNKLAPFTKVHAFEPNPTESASLDKNPLKKRFSEYHIHESALSDVEGTVELNVMNNSGMSSLLEPDLENYYFHFGMMKGFDNWEKNIAVNEKVKVKVNTLDLFASESNISQIDFLKLDTQGTELKILKGATRLLENHSISIIKTEVAFVPVYKEQCLFSDIDIFLRSKDMIFTDCLFYPDIIYQKSKSKTKLSLTDKMRYSAGGDAIFVLNMEKVNSDKRKETALKAGVILAELNYKSHAFDFLTRHAKLPEETAVKAIQFLSQKSLRQELKNMIKDWCPPKLLNFLK